jgi:hypothetical protein
VEKWDEVSVSEEFEQCCQEVAAGEYVSRVSSFLELSLTGWLRWGAQGGKTLMALFRRLRSPLAYSGSRN